MRTIITLCLAVCLAATGTSFAAEAVTSENLKQELRKIFQQNPEILLDVLREHSETVLDIAQQGSNMRRKRSLEAQWKVDSTQPKNVAMDKRPVRGSQNAPVTIVAFSDFTCPYCEQGANILRQIMDKNADKVRLVFKHMPLSEDSVGQTASEYFVAAGMQSNEKAWQMYDAMFANRSRLVAEGKKYLDKLAEQVGLNMNQLRSDLKSGKVKKVITEDLADAKKLNIEGTPYFLVNNMVVRGALPYDLFNTAVKMALKQN